MQESVVLLLILRSVFVECCYLLCVPIIGAQFKNKPQTARDPSSSVFPENVISSSPSPENRVFAPKIREVLPKGARNAATFVIYTNQIKKKFSISFDVLVNRLKINPTQSQTSIRMNPNQN